MPGAAARLVVEDPGRALFEAIGAFLAEHRLGYDPIHYAFAHRVLAAPTGPLARTVAALTEGGVRLTDRDVASLNGGRTADTTADSAALQRAEALVEQTRVQMDDFTGLMSRIRAETKGFGRDLAASVDAIDAALAPEIVDLAAAMLSRVQHVEAKLDSATAEAAELRAELAEARDDARVDALTGLGNRRALMEAFDAFKANGANGCLAICDIDHFKRINDQFGHGVGDRVLSAIATTLAESCRGAQVTRYGGEEFAILFDGVALADAVALLDRARATVAGKRYRIRDSEVVLGTITFSAGVVTARKRESFEAAFERADALLYNAKEGGRNQIWS
jgi:diguanylate cyclase